METRFEKPKTEKKEPEEIEIKGEEIPKEKIVMGIRNLLDKREIPRKKLPTWLQHLTKIEEKPIKITKDEYGKDIRLYFQDIGIRIRVNNLEPPEVEIKIREKGEDISKIYLDKELSERIIKKEGFLEMIKKGEKWIVLKQGTETYGFNHIVRKHFKEFEEKLGIKTEEELKNLIIKSVKETQEVKWKEGGKLHRYQEKGVWVETIIDPSSNSIITSYPE